MTDNKKAIIFLTPLSNSANRKRRSKLLNTYCQQNNFSTLKIIETTNSFNYLNLCKLINEIKSEPKGTFSILIEDKILNNPHNIILISALGTLYLLGLINTEIYKKSYQEIKLYESITTKNDFLSIADFRLHYTLECYKNQNND